METPDMKYTGLIIKALREKAGENQEQLAAALQVANRETVARWESGARDLKREHIIALARHFNVSADYLLGLSEVASVEADVQTACKVTGLREGAVRKLGEIRANSLDGENFSNTMSGIIEADSIIHLLECLWNFVETALAEIYAKEADPILIEIAENNEFSLEVREQFFKRFANRFGFSAESLYHDSEARSRHDISWADLAMPENYGLLHTPHGFRLDARQKVELFEYHSTKQFQSIIGDFLKFAERRYPEYKDATNKAVKKLYSDNYIFNKPETEEEQRFGEYIRKLFEEEAENNGKHNHTP